MNKAILLALLSAVLFTTACQKTKDVVNPPSQTELLADGPWKLIAQDVEPPVPGSTVRDEYAQLEDCEKDNNLNYTTTNSFTIDEGDTKCNANDPQAIAGSWALNGEGNVLTMTFSDGGQTESRNISILTRNDMTLTETWSAGGINYIRTFVYEH